MEKDVGAGRPLLARPATRAGIVIMIAGLAIGFDAAFAQRHGFFDLNVYWGAINHWVSGQGELYDFVRPASTYGFTYPPFAAIAMLPMALVSWPVAIVIASTGTVVATLLVVRWCLRQSPATAGWFAVGVAMATLMIFEPLRETFLFGQVNMLLVAVVAADLLFGVRKGRWWAGLGIGLATAVKLTPGIFIVYLLITGRFRAAFAAMGAAAGGTLLAAAVAPDAAREFFTSAIWDTDRIGALWFISNQSLQGVAARLAPEHPNRLLWLAMVACVLTVWVVRVRRAHAAGDEAAGLALTGTVGCLLSPVTWVHHLVWLIPGLLLMVVAAVERRDRRLLLLAVALFALLSSRVIWLFDPEFGPGWSTSGVIGTLGSNAYVWACVVSLVAVPIRLVRKSPSDGVAQLGQLDLATARGERLPRAVRV